MGNRFMGIDNFDSVYHHFGRMLLLEGRVVDTGHWQAMTDVPQTKTIELAGASLQYPIEFDVIATQEDVKPNLPWAENHFQERVSGQPLNPAPSHVDWPFAQQGNEQHIQKIVFSHTYPERMWPKLATEGGSKYKRKPIAGINRGIRYPLGDLGDVVKLLAKHPYTRQAWLPIWFPEDTGAVEGQRVPCSIGYQFMIRNIEGKDRLSIYYLMRSTDLFRHLRDDIYMAIRLAQWVRNLLQDYKPEWHLELGSLTFHTNSLHVFEPEMNRLRREFGD